MKSNSDTVLASLICYVLPFENLALLGLNRVLHLNANNCDIAGEEVYSLTGENPHVRQDDGWIEIGGDFVFSTSGKINVQTSS